LASKRKRFVLTTFRKKETEMILRLALLYSHTNYFFALSFYHSLSLYIELNQNIFSLVDMFGWKKCRIFFVCQNQVFQYFLTLSKVTKAGNLLNLIILEKKSI